MMNISGSFSYVVQAAHWVAHQAEVSGLTAAVSFYAEQAQASGAAQTVVLYAKQAQASVWAIQAGEIVVKAIPCLGELGFQLGTIGIGATSLATLGLVCVCIIVYRRRVTNRTDGSGAPPPPPPPSTLPTSEAAKYDPKATETPNQDSTSPQATLSPEQLQQERDAQKQRQAIAEREETLATTSSSPTTLKKPVIVITITQPVTPIKSPELQAATPTTSATTPNTLKAPSSPSSILSPDSAASVFGATLRHVPPPSAPPPKEDITPTIAVTLKSIKNRVIASPKETELSEQEQQDLEKLKETQAQQKAREEEQQQKIESAAKEKEEGLAKAREALKTVSQENYLLLSVTQGIFRKFISENQVLPNPQKQEFIINTAGEQVYGTKWRTPAHPYQSAAFLESFLSNRGFLEIPIPTYRNEAKPLEDLDDPDEWRADNLPNLEVMHDSNFECTRDTIALPLRNIPEVERDLNQPSSPLKITLTKAEQAEEQRKEQERQNLLEEELQKIRSITTQAPSPLQPPKPTNVVINKVKVPAGFEAKWANRPITPPANPIS